MTPPKISIITPSFNQGKFIEKTILSIINQDYKNVEHIVIDAKSTDETLSLLKKYSSRLTWLSEKDSGQANAINKGIKLATGDIIAYLNSDDYYLPGTLSKVAGYFSVHPNAMWLTGQCKIVNEKENVIQTYITHYKNFLRIFRSRHLLEVANFIDQPSTFWRKQILTDIGLFDESQSLCLDYDYWLRIIQKYPIGYLPTPLSAFRIHGQSKGATQFQKQFEQSYHIVSRYCHNRLLLTLHTLHNRLTIFIYKIIKN